MGLGVAFYYFAVDDGGGDVGAGGEAVAFGEVDEAAAGEDQGGEEESELSGWGAGEAAGEGCAPEEEGGERGEEDGKLGETDH